MPLITSFFDCRMLLVLTLFCSFNVKECQSDTLEKSSHQESNNESNLLEGSNQQNQPLRRKVYGYIVPIIHSDSSGLEINSSVLSRAEVTVFQRSKIPDPHADGLIRASSILMEYDEDTRKFLMPKGHDSENHRIRHSSLKNLLVHFSNGDNLAANDAPLSKPAAEQLLALTFSPLTNNSILLSGGMAQDLNKPRVQRKTKSLDSRNDTWIALHSPIRIFIPVRQGKNVSSTPANTHCVQCFSNLVVTAHPGETEAEVPLPAITICPRLASQGGRINVAVIAGPQPGSLVSEGQHSVELIIWKSGGQVFSCAYTLDVNVGKCGEILPPDGGAIECSNRAFLGSTCKFFCLPGYILQGSDSVTCAKLNGTISWSSSFPICKKTETKPLPPAKRFPCLKPKQPTHGTVVCDSSGRSIYPDGSICQFFCYPGFVIKSLHTMNALTVCKNGQWTPNKKVSCIATYCSEPPPSPLHGSMRCDKYAKDPSFRSKYENGTFCHVNCDTGYTISKSQQSLNRIICNAPYWNHSSNLECKQIITPQPHPKDCKNVTVIANRKGFTKIKASRFSMDNFLSRDKGENVVYGNCTYTGKIGVGVYLNNCSISNEELNTTGFCSYFITVRENTCSFLPEVENSILKCNNKNASSLPKKTVCRYVCTEGFIVPLREGKFTKKVCSPKLEWRPSSIPSCQRAIPPSPRKGSCTPQTLAAKSDHPVKIKKPRFKSSLPDGKVKVRCSLNNPLPPGNYTNECQARDKKLGLISTCLYNITIIENLCTALFAIPSASVRCFNSTNKYFSVGTICQYECDTGYIIPTDLLPKAVKICTDDYVWNSTLIPDCVLQTAPTPEEHSCAGYTILVDASETHEVIVPRFKSSNGTRLEVECNPLVLNSFGMHQINCTAFDPQLRVSGSCSFNAYLQDSGNNIASTTEGVFCPSPKGENGENECKFVRPNLYSPGTICEFICNEGFTIPISQRDSSIFLCLDSAEWNVTDFPNCVKFKEPALVSGCSNHSVSASNIEEVSPSPPVYLTSRNEPATVSCTPDTFEDYGEYEISCTAIDYVLGSIVNCSFYLDIVKYEAGNSTDISSPLPVVPCEPLVSPSKGLLNCTGEEHCTLICEEDFVFPSVYRNFIGKVTCDGTDGLWDFQRQYNISHLPECLGQLPNTSARVFLTFSASVNNCSDELFYSTVIKTQLFSINKDMCLEVDCDSLVMNCLEEQDLLKGTINVNWTLRTAFSPPPDGVVPKYEKNIEAILNSTRFAILSDEQFSKTLQLNNIKIHRDSFNRNHLILECDKEGYGVDWNTEKCVECPSAYMEIDSECIQCPPGQFQLKSGQTKCEMCSDDTFLNKPIPSTCKS